jgi:protein tyrosine/serine phosphatase
MPGPQDEAVPSPRTADPVAADAPGPQRDLSAVDIENFGRVTDRYFRGEQPDTRQFEALAALGVKTIVDLRRWHVQAEEKKVRAAGMRFVSVPLSAKVPPSDADIRRFLEAVSDPANQPVFVHCEAGRDRTGAVTAIYRLTYDHWSLKRAVSEMRQYGFHDGNDVLKEYVEQYAQRLNRA